MGIASLCPSYALCTQENRCQRPGFVPKFVTHNRPGPCPIELAIMKWSFAPVSPALIDWAPTPIPFSRWTILRKYLLLGFSGLMVQLSYFDSIGCDFVKGTVVNKGIPSNIVNEVRLTSLTSCY